MFTAVANRSSVVGLLGNTVDRCGIRVEYVWTSYLVLSSSATCHLKRATSIWSAGAYLHWYEKCGCSKQAVRCAIEQV